MKFTLKIIGVILILIISTKNSFSQNSDFTRIGNIKDEIYLDRYEDYYLLTYEDINMDSKGGIISFKLNDKDATNKLYRAVKNSFSQQNNDPITLNLQGAEIRIYYKERILKADYVEIIHENMETESTGTLPWLTSKDLDKLFGK